MKLFNYKIWLISSLLLVGSVLVLVLFLVNTSGLRYEFSEGFHGWVVIQYGDSRCPELQTKAGYLNLQFPASGCLCTATPPPEGFRTRLYEYVSRDGRRITIPEKYADRDSQIWEHVTNQKTFTRELFFVGTHDQYTQAPKVPDILQHHCKELGPNPPS